MIVEKEVVVEKEVIVEKEILVENQVFIEKDASKTVNVIVGRGNESSYTNQ